jgi:DNA polymerase-1
MAADYSQIELRILAHLSGDPGLQEAFRENRDIHTRTAAALFNLPEKEITPGMRRDAKVVNFGIIYGMGARRLAWELNISQSKAADFIQNYFNRYTRVKSFMRETVDKARKTGYVTTLSGRKRFLPELSSGNRLIQTNAERMAANTPIQGSAADLIKKAMIDIDTALSRTNLDCEMLLQVHDELVFEVANKDLPRASALVKDKMENAMTFNVPLKVDVGAGHNWLQAHG